MYCLLLDLQKKKKLHSMNDNYREQTFYSFSENFFPIGGPAPFKKILLLLASKAIHKAG